MCQNSPQYSSLIIQIKTSHIPNPAAPLPPSIPNFNRQPAPSLPPMKRAPPAASAANSSLEQTRRAPRVYTLAHRATLSPIFHQRAYPSPLPPPPYCRRPPFFLISARASSRGVYFRIRLTYIYIYFLPGLQARVFLGLARVNNVVLLRRRGARGKLSEGLGDKPLGS